MLVANSVASTYVPEYSDSVEVYSEKDESSFNHRILLSTPKRINNTLQIETQQIVNGERTNKLLEIKPGYTIKDARLFYLNFFNARGELLYSCEKRACGSSNYWANKILNEHQLYGRDSNQFYLAGKLKQGEKTLWLSVYGVKNGLKKNLIYISVISELTDLQGKASGELLSNDSKSESNMGSKLNEGYVFNKQNIPESDLIYIRDLLSAKPDYHLYLAAYSALDGGSVSSNLNVLSDEARQMKDYLLDVLGLKSSRLHLQEIGPFGGVRVINEQIWYRIFILKP